MIAQMVVEPRRGPRVDGTWTRSCLGRVEEFELRLEKLQKEAARLGLGRQLGIEPISTGIGLALSLAKVAMDNSKQAGAKRACGGSRHAMRSNSIRQEIFSWAADWPAMLSQAGGDEARAKILTAEKIASENPCEEGKAAAEFLSKKNADQATKAAVGTPMEPEIKKFAEDLKKAVNTGAGAGLAKSLAERLSTMDLQISKLSFDEQVKAKALLGQLGIKNDTVGVLDTITKTKEDASQTDKAGEISQRLGQMEDIVKGLGTKTAADRSDALKVISELQKPAIPAESIVLGIGGSIAAALVIKLLLA
jgi:hypothetical protein